MFNSLLRAKPKKPVLTPGGEPALSQAVPVANADEPVRVALRTTANHTADASTADAAASSIAEPIKSADGLPAFERMLYADANLNEELRHLLCPVQITPAAEGAKARYAIILTAEMLQADETATLIRALSSRYEKAEPFYYPAAPQVVTALSRDDGSTAVKKVYVGSRTVGTGALWSNFEEISRFGVDMGASDILLNVYDASDVAQLQYIIDGHVVEPTVFRFSKKDMLDTKAHVFQRGSGSSQGAYGADLPQQTSIKATIGGKTIVFRWASMKSEWGPTTVLRLNEQYNSLDEVPKFADLGMLPDQCEMLTESMLQKVGATVFGGTVNSGKTKTAVSGMAQQPEYLHRMTFEDPVENYLPGVKHYSFSRTLGDELENAFFVGQQQIKRMNPHACHIGEARDHQSGAFFRDVAGSGVRTSITTHCGSATGIPARLSDAEIRIPRDVLGMADFINLYAFQALLPRTCKCAIKGHEAKQILGTEYLNRLDRLFGIDVDAVALRNPEGCPRCRRPGMPTLHGIRGRIAVAEMFPTDEESLSLIRACDDIGLKNYIRSWKTTDCSSPVTLGKSAYEVAMYRVHTGQIDPRAVEQRFGSLTSWERARHVESKRQTSLQLVG
jgi:type II secretory ATPase GspE/PulE/Tfp pilus assembly ATPase PilB-like protein